MDESIELAQDGRGGEGPCMDFVKRTTLILVGVAVVFTAAWLMPKGMATEERAEVARKLADLERRVSRLERHISDVASPAPSSGPVAVESLRKDFAASEERSSSVAVSPGPRTHAQVDMSPSSIRVSPRPSETSLESGQLERLVAEVVASLTPEYLAEQVSQLYAAQKKADEDAQREAEQRRAQEQRQRRLAQLAADLQTFVPGLTPFQVEEVSQVIGEQWEAMAAMRQQARENGTLTGPGEILRKAREMTDEKLYVILSPPQLEAFRLWRETRFGATER
jgi:hypothetical protein